MKNIMLMIPFLLSACASVKVLTVNKHLPSKPEECKIEVLSKEPSKKYEEIAVLEGTGGESNGAYISDAKAWACELGGDALIMGSSVAKTEGGGEITYTRLNTTLSVIKYTK